jgi:DNA polymerase-4
VRVGVKVCYVPFETRQRSLTLPAPTRDPEVVAAAAVELVGRLDRTRAVRLLGVRAEMAPPGGAAEPGSGTQVDGSGGTDAVP